MPASEGRARAPARTTCTVQQAAQASSLGDSDRGSAARPDARSDAGLSLARPPAPPAAPRPDRDRRAGGGDHALSARRATAGRLSELCGSDQVDADAFIRTLGWRRVAEQEWTLLSPDTKRYLQDYAEGVNAYLADHQGSRASLEYALLW